MLFAKICCLICELEKVSLQLLVCFCLFRLTAQQHDNLSLKQQLETALAAASDRSGIELHDKLNTMMTSLKADHEKVKCLC